MRRGFSLVEVLIAVLVLALGLLGLGAVFPVVIAQQRRAFDSTQGSQVADLAVETLTSGSEVVDISRLWSLDEYGRLALGTPLGSRDGGSAGATLRGSPDRSLEWIAASLADAAGGRRPPFLRPVPGFDSSNFSDLRSGLWRSDMLSAADQGTLLPVQARMFPQPGSGADPRYVWDPVVRRLPGDAAQVVIFVRRIDERIRVPSGYTLGELLTGSRLPSRATRAYLPLALDLRNGRLTTDDGQTNNSVYPIPLAVDVDVYADHLDWLVLRQNDAGSSEFDTSLDFLRQIGQRVVDNTGVVRTVVGLPTVEQGGDTELASRGVVVDPPFTRDQASDGRGTGRLLPKAWERTTWVKQVVFTPQVPVAVRVYTLERE